MIYGRFKKMRKLDGHGKVRTVVLSPETVEQAIEEDRKILIFSYFTDTITRIKESFNSVIGVIDGKSPLKKRQDILDEFEKSSAGSILLSQIVAGGTGLNIQSASVVVICEPQVKPSIESQAIARAYRMGQNRNVLVYKLLCRGTIDEKMTAMLKSKQQIFDAFADESNAAEQDTKMELSLQKIIEDEFKTN